MNEVRKERGPMVSRESLDQWSISSLSKPALKKKKKRSPEAVKRRLKKNLTKLAAKLENSRETIIFTPALTPADKKTNLQLPPPIQIIREDTQLLDVYSAKYLVFLTNHFNTETQKRLMSSWDQYLEPKLEKFKDRRGNRKGTALGFWMARGHSRVTDQVYASPAFKNSKQEILEEFGWLGGLVSKALLQNFPHIAQTYASISSAFRPFGLFSLMMPFKGGSSHLHLDRNDAHGGVCAVVALGKFEGGELEIVSPNSSLHLQICMNAGDLLFFRSHELEHRNLRINGDRRVLVFVSQNSLLNREKLRNGLEDEEDIK